MRNGFLVCEGTFSLLEHKRKTYNANSSTASRGGRYASCTPSARRAVAVSMGRRGKGKGQRAGNALGDGDASALVLAARLEVEALDVPRREGRVRARQGSGRQSREASRQPSLPVCGDTMVAPWPTSVLGPSCRVGG